LIDPKRDDRVVPDFNPEDFVARPRDPTRKKTEEEIPRVPEIDIHMEEIPIDENNVNLKHMDEAEK